MTRSPHRRRAHPVSCLSTTPNRRPEPAHDCPADLHRSYPDRNRCSRASAVFGNYSGATPLAFRRRGASVLSPLLMILFRQKYPRWWYSGTGNFCAHALAWASIWADGRSLPVPTSIILCTWTSHIPTRKTG